MGSWPDLRVRLGYTSVRPSQDTGGSMDREEHFSSVWVKGRACLKAEFVCWVESASWSCWDHSCVFQPGSASPSLQPPGPARSRGVGERMAARAAELSQLCFSCSLSPARVNKYLEIELHYQARTISFFHVLCSLELTSSSSDIGELSRDKKKF